MKAADTSTSDPWLLNQLPDKDQLPQFDFPDSFVSTSNYNCIEDLLDAHVPVSSSLNKNAIANRQHTAIIHADEVITYEMLGEQVASCCALLAHLGVKPGQRVLLRDFNTAALAILWLATLKLGAVAVTVMPLLRRRELNFIVQKVKPVVAFVSNDCRQELDAALADRNSPTIVHYNDGQDLLNQCQAHTPIHTTVRTHSSDVALIAFTSGTTGQPKGTLHCHRDIRFVCEAVADSFLGMSATDIVTGTSPLAFTFGLGGLLLFPLYAGATTVLEARYTPEALLNSIQKNRATLCFTVPTFYRRLLPLVDRQQIATLRHCVSSGESLGRVTRADWEQRTGLIFTELLGATEMLHAFVGSTPASFRNGAIGRAFGHYTVTILDEQGNKVATGESGALAVRGPTGCRYLSDQRQTDYVKWGWNLTGDSCSMDEDGYVYFSARRDEMIVSSGYNISGLEIEDLILTFRDVVECAVVGLPDADRGMVVTAFVVVSPVPVNVAAWVTELQVFAKAELAPYKYPRSVFLVDELPRNNSGKLQRFRLTAEYASGVVADQ